MTTKKRGRPALPDAKRLSARITVRLYQHDEQLLARVTRTTAASDSETLRRALYALAAELGMQTREVLS